MQKEITIYTTQDCKYCESAKEFFKENNIPYTEHDVGPEGDPAKRDEMIALTGRRAVPVIVVGEDVMLGFDLARMRQLLAM